MVLHMTTLLVVRVLFLISSHFWHAKSFLLSCNYSHISVQTVIMPLWTAHFNSKDCCCFSHLCNPREACVKCSPVSHLNRTLVSDRSHSRVSVHKSRTSFPSLHGVMTAKPAGVGGFTRSPWGACWTISLGSNPLEQSKVKQEVIARKGNRH